MNWLKNIVPPKLRKLVGVQKEVPDNLWHSCPACSQMIFHRELVEKLYVCPKCDYHFRVSGKNRVTMLLDELSYNEVRVPTPTPDPLKFRDIKKYTERLKAAQEKTGQQDVLNMGVGKMGGINVILAIFDFSFMGGSMGAAVGDGILKAAQKSIEEKSPLIIVSASGGARMQEGVLSLMQLSRTTIAINQVKKAGLPYISVLTDPTTGGVSASFAMLGDIAIAEPGCIIGFAGQRVIEQTIRENLPDGFQKAEYLLDHGMVDMVIHRHKLRETLIRVLKLLTISNDSELIKIMKDNKSDLNKSQLNHRQEISNAFRENPK